jgi:hypothetical protein
VNLKVNVNLNPAHGPFTFRFSFWASPGFVDTGFQAARSNSIGLR